MVATGSAETKHLTDRLNAAQIKLKRLARLETTIVDFFLEVMERTASLPGTSIQLQAHGTTYESDNDFMRAKRKEEFLRKAEGDPIALLNSLRTHLRIQFARHEEQHHQQEHSISSLTSSSIMKERDTQAELKRWERACETAREQMRVMNEQMTVSQEDHARVSRQYKRNLEALNSELHELRSTVSQQSTQLAAQARQLEELGRVNEALAREKKRLNEEVLARSHGAHSANGSPTPGDQCRFLGSDGFPMATPAEQQTIRRALKKLEAENSRLDAANIELRTETQRLHQQIVGLRQNSNAQHVAKMEKEIQKSREALAEGSKKLADLEGELLRTKGVLKERDTRIQHMKDEYNKLFAALQKLKQTTPSRPVHSASNSSLLRRTRSTASASSLESAPESTSAGAGESDQANENPYLLEHYRAKIEQLEKQIESLQTQFRKIIASEYRHKQKNKLLRSERMQLVDSCDRLRGELERAVMTTAKAMAQNTSLAAKQQQHHQQQQQQLQSQPISTAPHDADDDDGDPTEHHLGANGDQSSVRESISDLVRLRQRNQYLEERFRALDSPATTSTTPQRRGSEVIASSEADAAPPPSSEPTAQHSAATSATARALQDLQHSARRSRPQSAGASTQTATARRSSSLRIGASPLALQPRSLL